MSATASEATRLAFRLASIIKKQKRPGQTSSPAFFAGKKTMSDETSSPSLAAKARLRQFAVAVAVIVAAFGFPLFKLADFAVHDDLFSYILLIPFTSFYLARLLQKQFPTVSEPAKRWAAIFLAGGLAALGAHFIEPGSTVADSLAWPMLALVLFVTGAGFLFLGGAMMRVLAFPFSLLVFMVPFPDGLRVAIETWLQHASADAASWMFALAGMPVYHNDLVFQLPDITLQIAPECSGIHSSMVLLIVSLVAGHLFLRHPAKRAVLCLAVIPLAFLRNGFRVFVLGELCTHLGPQMIDSPIHHRGGPVFFVVSLVPFSLLLYCLMKSDRPEISGRPSASGN
jgi:exosortase C (VPDSG-CTERM-specific)